MPRAWHVPASELALIERERRRLDATAAFTDFDDVSHERLAAMSVRVGRLQAGSGPVVTR